MLKVWNKRDKNVPPNAVYIGRPSKWGNPYQIGISGTREEVIQMYKEDLEDALASNPRYLDELKGKDLVCWCAPKPCHGDVLLELANPDLPRQASREGLMTNEQTEQTLREAREAIAEICWNCEHFKNNTTWEEAKIRKEGVLKRSYEAADQILALPLIEQARREERAKMWEEVNSLLSISMNEMGFVEISNHVDFGDWQDLNKEDK